MDVAFLAFPEVTQLDLTGPQEVLSRIPGARTHLYWKSLDAVRSASGLLLMPTDTFEGAAAIDVLCVPGGPGIDVLLDDAATLEFVRRAARSAKYVTSVCTGSLVLGAAGVLRGKRATSHWASLELLASFGATPCDERIVEDGRIVTAGGVTAGIDFGFLLLARIAGDRYAQEVQLAMQYDPQPPFDAGTPAAAAPEVLDSVRARFAEVIDRRRGVVKSLGFPG